MLPINNSDTAWLIVTDYNQDNYIPFEELREDILNPETNQWHDEISRMSLLAGSNARYSIGKPYWQLYYY